MPPRFNVLPQVREQGLPDARMAPIPQGTYDTRQAQANLGAIQESQQQISFYDAMGAMTQLKKRELDSRYQEVLGENARELPKQMREEYQKWTSELADTLTDPRARAMFQRKADENEISFIGNVEQHALRQKTVAEAQKTDAFVSTWQDAGAKAAGEGNFAEADRAAQEIDHVWRLHGVNNGIPSVAVEQSIKESNSKLYTGGIISMLNNQQEQAAKDYFGQVKDKLTEKDRERLLPKLNESATLGEAYKWRDIVLSYQPETLQAGLDHLEKLTAQEKLDPKVRQEAERLISQGWQAQNHATKVADDQRFEGVAAQLRKTGNFEDLQRSDVWTELPERDKEHLELMASRMAKGESPYAKVSDPKVTAAFFGMNKADVASLSPADLQRYAPYVTEGKYNDMEKHWNAARNKEDDAAFKTTEHDDAKIFDAIKRSGIVDLQNVKALYELKKESNKTKAENYQPIWDEVLDRYKTFFHDKGKNPNQEEKEQMLKDVIIDKTLHKKMSLLQTVGPYSSVVLSSPVGWLGVGAGAAYDYYRRSKNDVEVTAEDRSRIASQIQGLGGEVSAEKVQRIKRAELAGASDWLLRKLAQE